MILLFWWENLGIPSGHKKRQSKYASVLAAFPTTSVVRSVDQLIPIRVDYLLRLCLVPPLFHSELDNHPG